MNFESIVKKLTNKNLTVSTMESCTGGAIVNAITNIEGASEVLKYSAITYANDFKIKMGVSSKTIDKYSVYSMEVAKEMAYNISKFTGSNFGIGVTGKLNRVDKLNPYGEDNTVFISIYNKDKNDYNGKKVQVLYNDRKENKELILREIIKLLENMI